MKEHGKALGKYFLIGLAMELGALTVRELGHLARSYRAETASGRTRRGKPGGEVAHAQD